MTQYTNFSAGQVDQLDDLVADRNLTEADQQLIEGTFDGILNRLDDRFGEVDAECQRVLWNKIVVLVNGLCVQLEQPKKDEDGTEREAPVAEAGAS